jgi:hypothetical protein
MRPLPVLEDTLDYLLSLSDSTEYPFHVVHDFIFDRTRSIRQDLSMQNIVNDKAICMYEKMVCLSWRKPFNCLPVLHPCRISHSTLAYSFSKHDFSLTKTLAFFFSKPFQSMLLCKKFIYLIIDMKKLFS